MSFCVFVYLCVLCYVFATFCVSLISKRSTVFTGSGFRKPMCNVLKIVCFVFWVYAFIECVAILVFFVFCCVCA